MNAVFNKAFISERKVTTSDPCGYLKFGGGAVYFLIKKQKYLPHNCSTHSPFVQMDCSEPKRKKLPFILMKIYKVVSLIYPECRQRNLTDIINQVLFPHP